MYIFLRNIIYMYKIRIDCTSKDNLCFDNKKIKKECYNNIHSRLQPSNINYII